MLKVVTMSGLLAAACWLVGCGDESDGSSTTSTTGGADTSAIEAKLDELNGVAKKRREAACACLSTLNSEDFPDKQACIDDVTDDSLLALDSSCVIEAVGADVTSGEAFVDCLLDDQAEATTCWEGCGANLEEHQQDYDCHNKSGARLNACGDDLSDSAADAVSDCLKGG